MGTPLPPFTEADEPCSCFGSGSGLGVKTPKYIRVIMTDMEPGNIWVPEAEELNKGVYQLTQRLGFNCEWLLILGGFEVILRMGGGVGGGLFLSLITLGDFFRGPSAAACVTAYDDTPGVPADKFFINGHAELEFGENG